MSAALAWLRARPSRVLAGVALATVAIVTGVVSYTHISALTLVLHGSQMVAHLMPFGVDGQIVMGSVVLLTGRGRTAWWGWLGIVPGLAESLFANWESGIANGLLAAAWATVPAQAFAGSTFMFERWVKSLVSATAQAGPAGPRGILAEGGARESGPGADEAAGPVVPPTPELALLAFLESGPQREVGAMIGVSKSTVGRWIDRLKGGEVPGPELAQDGPDDAAVADPVRYAAMNGAAAGG